MVKLTIITNIMLFFSLFSSVQEVDPLYIAYADMMAKVFLPLCCYYTLKDFHWTVLTSDKTRQWWSEMIPSQSCAEDEEEEEEEGKEKTFEVCVWSHIPLFMQKDRNVMFHCQRN